MTLLLHHVMIGLFSQNIIYIMCYYMWIYDRNCSRKKKDIVTFFIAIYLVNLWTFLVLFIFIFHFLLQTKQEALQSFYNLSRNSFTLLNFLDFFKLIDRQMRLMQLIMNLPQLQRSVRTLPVLRIISR